MREIRHYFKWLFGDARCAYMSRNMFKENVGGHRREDMKNKTAELCAHTSIITVKSNESGC